MTKPAVVQLLLVTVLALSATAPALKHSAVRHRKAATPLVEAQKVIFDTDIGDDVDDAYALALLLRSPEIKILGITTAFGDTHLRARLVSRFLKAAGRESIPVFEGPKTEVKNGLTQAAWALESPDKPYADAIPFILDTVRANPGQVTLIAVAPLTTVGALIAEDPTTFRLLKRVVLMGGSIDRGYGNVGHPDAEWNIVSDIASARALFTSGVPLFVMPLDSTQIPLDAGKREAIFHRGTPLTGALKELTQQWAANAHYGIPGTPTLFDVVATAYALDPTLCPATPMAIEVDEKGFTRRAEGAPNANVCLSSSADTFFAFYLPRLDR